MIVIQPTPNDFSFNNSRNQLDLSNTSIGNYSQIPPQSIPSMYQTSSQYQTQPSFVYGNPSITYTSNNNHSRTSSASFYSRQMPTDASFGLDANSYSQLNYNNRYDQSANTGNTMNPQSDVSKSSLAAQQNSASNLIPTSNGNLSADSNVLPPLSEVFPTSSTASSPTQSQVQQVQAQQQVANAAAQNGFFYSDVNAAAVANAAAAASYAAAAENTYGSTNQNPLMSQAQQQQAAAQIASNIPVDPRTLPRLGGTDLQQASIQTAAMLDPSRRNSILAINTGLAMGSDQSPLSAGSSTGSPIVYQQHPVTAHQAAAHQALLNSHFMAAAQSMNNSGMMTPSQRLRGGKYRPDDGDLTAERPQKVYSFVALPGINTKKRPRRRYDEIERHYACNYPGCTKSYGTLNHLNAHVQMQKHGPKRHPSEFKELRKQWRRQKREEEERKAAEVAATKNAVASLNIPCHQTI